MKHPCKAITLVRYKLNESKSIGFNDKEKEDSAGDSWKEAKVCFDMDAVIMFEECIFNNDNKTQGLSLSLRDRIDLLIVDTYENFEAKMIAAGLLPLPTSEPIYTPLPPHT